MVFIVKIHHSLHFRKAYFLSVEVHCIQLKFKRYSRVIDFKCSNHRNQG